MLKSARTCEAFCFILFGKNSVLSAIRNTAGVGAADQAVSASAFLILGLRMHDSIMLKSNKLIAVVPKKETGRSCVSTQTASLFYFILSFSLSSRILSSYSLNLPQASRPAFCYSN